MLSALKKFTTKKFILLILPIYLLGGTISLYHNEAVNDEYRNHLPVLKGMYEQGFFTHIFGDEYETANTPLPYLPAYLVFRIFSVEPNLIIPRLINILVSLLTTLLFLTILKKISNANDYTILLFVFYPYFIKTSYVFYITLYGTFFMLLYVYFQLRENKLNNLWSGSAVSAGILSQQYLIALIPVHILDSLNKYFKEHNNFKLNRQILFYIPLIIPLILFLLWGGLTHPGWGFHRPVIDISHITAVFCITGGIFFPFFLDRFKTIKLIPAIVSLTLSMVLVFFFLPHWAEYGSYGLVTGYTFHFLNLLEGISIPLSTIISVFLCSSGIYLLIYITTLNKNNIQKLIYSAIIFFCIIFFLDVIFSERHLLPMITLLFLLIIPQIQNRLILISWIVYQVIFGSVCFYYWFFINPGFP